MMTPLKITFHLDGTGVYYDPFEPIMLDALLAWCAARHHVHGEPPARDEQPFDIPLPLARWHRGDVWGWRASALFPEGDSAESLVFWRKRLRQDRVHLTEGSPNLTNGVYRDWNMPLPLLLCRTMVAYAFGDRRQVRHELVRNVRWLGKKRAHGRGRVVSIEVDRINDDYSILRDGQLMRWMPSEEGSRLVRPRPPYWNICGRVRCAEIGDVMPVTEPGKISPNGVDSPAPMG